MATGSETGRGRHLLRPAEGNEAGSGANRHDVGIVMYHPPMVYPITGMVRGWAPQDYEYGYALSPHGISTAIPAAYVFRNLANVDFDRFEQIARVLNLRAESTRQLADNFFEYYIDLLTTLGIPMTLKELGFTPQDVDNLVVGTLAQQRLLSLAPIQVTEGVLFDQAIVRL